MIMSLTGKYISKTTSDRLNLRIFLDSAPKNYKNRRYQNICWAV